MRHSARQHWAEAPLHPFQDPLLYIQLPAPSAGSIVAPAVLVPWNRRVMAAEFIKIWKWERVHPLLHVWRFALWHSAVAPCILCRIYHCTFYHVYRQTRLFWAAAQNSKFLSQRARRSCFFSFARIHPPGKTFAQNFFTRMYLPEAICPKTHLPEAECPKTLVLEVSNILIILFRYNSIGTNAFGQKSFQVGGFERMGWNPIILAYHLELKA